MPCGDVFVASDIHYNHKNICRGVSKWPAEELERTTRDFKTLDEMNKTLLNNINKAISKKDTLILLGDIAFGGREYVIEFFDNIKCENILLVFGNHDQHLEADYNQDKKLAAQFGIKYLGYYNEFNFNKKSFVLSHYPFSNWHGMNGGSIHLHGHVHLKKEHKRLGARLDVGLDGNDYEPYLLQNIVKDMQ